MELSEIWQDYGLDRLEEGMRKLFPQRRLSLEALLSQLMEGDVLGAAAGFFQGALADVWGQFAGMKRIFLWLLALALLSALLARFVEMFDRRQVADLSFYFVYLLFAAALFRCFFQAAEEAAGALDKVIFFIRLMIPAYLLSLGAAGGAATAGAAAQLMFLVIYGVENLLLSGVLPLIYSMCMLAVLNGVWAEEKLTLLVELLEKAVGWLLKGALGVVTGLSVFQALLAPVLDSVRTSALQRLVSAIPGVGDAAGGVVDLMLGSAVVIKNSVGVALLLLFLGVCMAPLLRIGLVAGVLKCAAAFMGIVSDKRLTGCVNRAGDAGLLLLRTAGTAMLLFVISIAVLTASYVR